jgi:hypothetical protein
VHDIPVFWGRGIIEPDRAHARETVGGQPVADRTPDRAVTGFAICGCPLVADVTDERVVAGDYRLCSHCLKLLANRKPGVDYPLWTPNDWFRHSP